VAFNSERARFLRTEEPCRRAGDYRRTSGAGEVARALEGTAVGTSVIWR